MPPTLWEASAGALPSNLPHFKLNLAFYGDFVAPLNCKNLHATLTTMPCLKLDMKKYTSNPI